MPGILVKKADGTVVKMSLEEARKMKARSGAKNAVQDSKPLQVSLVQKNVVKPEDKKTADKVLEKEGFFEVIYTEEPVLDDKILEKEGHFETLYSEPEQIAEAKKVEPPPVKTIDISALKPKERKEIPAIKKDEDAHRSLLEEKFEPEQEGLPLTSHHRLDQVGQILEKAALDIPSDLDNRLRSVIQLFLKEVRDETKTKETLTRPIQEGGLGLSEEQSDEILKICRSVIELNSGQKKEEVKPLKTSVMSIKEEKIAPKPKQENKKTPSNISMEQKTLAPLPKKTVEKDFKLTSRPGISPDVDKIAPPPFAMGPIEEVGYMNLVDFRRLSGKPENSAGRLKQKLYNLRDESYVLYLQGLEAWRKSPLFTNYMEAVCQSILQRRPIEALLTDEQKIKMNEIKALIKMEEEL